VNARFSNTRLKLLGSGSALPGDPVDNDELLTALAAHCGSGKARLARKYAERLGIRSRHVSRDLNKAKSGTRAGFDAPTLCKTAVVDALGDSDMSYLIGHTSSPHSLLPPNIAWVADELRYTGPYVELRQACTGFANALAIAAAMIAEDHGAKIGIVGSENGSPYFDISRDFADREQLINFVQMGDGAGAVLLGADDSSGQDIVSDVFVGQIGLGMQPGIRLKGGGSADPNCDKGLPYFEHRASDVRRNGEKLITAGINAIESQGYSLGDFDWVIPHQVNGHVGRMFAERYPETEGRVFVTADRLGNLGSAAIWASFDELRRSGKLERGQRVLILGAEASKYLYGGFVYTH
jgi:3-oxoacyl-[acyl-carrier-protein] synthase-3